MRKKAGLRIDRKVHDVVATGLGGASNVHHSSTEHRARERRIRETARLILADDDSVTAWLNVPAPALAGRKPIELLTSDAGLAELEGLVRGLAYGNFQ